ncbi:MAG: hypothetical protein ABIX28_16730 [Vicinamibacterales bacterium]
MSKCASWRARGAAATLLLALAATADARQRPNPGPATIEERTAGAERVVVAAVESVTADYETNEFGDRLIVSHAKLAIQEAIKGSTEPLTIDYEGGTVDGITLHVSSLPVLRSGERGVFFVTRGKKGEFRPHLRGQGILKLDPQDRVPNSSLTLTDVRRMASSVIR